MAQVSWASSLHAGAAPQVSVTEWPQKAARFIGGCVSSVLPWPLAPGIPRLPGGQIIPQRASCQSPTSQSAFSSRGVLLTPSVQGPQESPYRAPWFRSNVPLKGPEGTLCPRSWVCSTPDPARPAELWEATVCPTLGKGPQHPRATNPPPPPDEGGGVSPPGPASFLPQGAHGLVLTLSCPPSSPPALSTTPWGPRRRSHGWLSGRPGGPPARRCAPVSKWPQTQTSLAHIVVCVHTEGTHVHTSLCDLCTCACVNPVHVHVCACVLHVHLHECVHYMYVGTRVYACLCQCTHKLIIVRPHYPRIP